jgi:hypothetical protein
MELDGSELEICDKQLKKYNSAPSHLVVTYIYTFDTIRTGVSGPLLLPYPEVVTIIKRDCGQHWRGEGKSSRHEHDLSAVPDKVRHAQSINTGHCTVASYVALVPGS